MTTTEATDEKIDATFRNGSLTVVGILVGFSLNFLGRWAENPNDWSRIDLLPAALFLVGIGLQVKVLANLLSRDSLLVARYDRSMRLFVIAVLVVGLGIIVALVNDILGLSHQKML